MLTKKELSLGLSELAQGDEDLAAVLDRHGPPPLWSRRPGFPTLVQIILEQQVSLASAKAAFLKLKNEISEVTPERLLTLDEAELKAIGFSRQKARYCRELSRAIVDERFDVKGLSRLPDADAKEALMSQVGIGRWTADIYLLMALRRPDIWPKGDLALAKAAQQVKNLAELPDQDQLEEMARSWRPWRAVAARVLWHHYLSGDGQSQNCEELLCQD
jgi:DNA-3-methyladenine glycosylase II